ncbi:MAG: hypothetical protein Q9210_003912 [Variospora velana]
MEDPNLIVTLIPADNDGYAENAFRRDKNKDRCLPPTRKIEDEGPVISSREATPARPLVFNQEPKLYVDPEQKHCIRLTFKPPPKDPAKGYAFGTDEQKCDVLLAHRGVRDTSGVHFHITFDVIRGKRRLVLRDSSTNGTAVSYDGQAEEEVRHHFPWILNLDKKNGTWKVKVHVRGLAFKVEFASHQTCETEYEKNTTEFLKLSQTADPPLGGLNIDSYMTEVAPSQSRTPGQRPVYIHEEPLGKGSFGQVDKVIDVSTGAIYAHKTFHEPLWAKYTERRRRREREKWLDQIRREIRIMIEHPHELIVPLLDFQEDPRPFLVMPYLPLGNLNQVHDKNPLAERETVDLLFQGLTVLQHLHSRGVAYRDLKPENILFESRFPLHLQFTDFGLANDQPDLQTFCGTVQYAAPELYIGRSYTTVVDIWSLGVIVLEYVYGLPTHHLQARTKGEGAIREQGLAWCRRLVEYANDWDPDPLINLLTRGMLQMEASQRLSAGACLTRAYELGLFDKPSASSERTTPTRPTVLTSGMRNEEETPTIVTGALWDEARDGSNDDGAVQARHSACDRRSVTPTSRQLGALKPPGDEGAPRLRKGPSEAVSNRSSDHIRSSLEVSYPPAARSVRLGSKRYRSPAVSPPGHPSDKSLVQRRSAEAYQIENPRSEGKGPSTLSKRRRPQAAQSPTTDAVGGGESKRARAFVSCEVGEQSAKVPSPGRVESINSHDVAEPSPYFVLNVLPQPLVVRKSDFRIRVIGICHAAGLSKDCIPRFQREFAGSFDRVTGSRYPGIYVDFWVGFRLCRRYDLKELEKELSKLKSIHKELELLEPAFSEPAAPKPIQFIEITGLSNPVMVRMTDLKINATNIITLYGRGREEIRSLKKGWDHRAYEIVRNGRKYQGTYVNLEIGIDLCRRYKLPELEKRLKELKRAPEGTVLEAEPGYLGPLSQGLPESPGLNTVSARNESTQPRGICNLDQRPASSAEPVPDGSIQAEQACETNPGSDGVDSRGSISPREPRSTEQNSQSVPSLRDIGDAAPLPQLGHNIRHSLLELADPYSHSTRNPQYEVWDSRSQLSGLIEVRPNLNPSTYTALSDYGSFDDLFAPT